MTVVDQDNLEQIVKEAGRPVFVDMYADWCGPCKMIAPIIDELANEYGNKIEFVKVNVDENPTSAAAYGVRSIPTLIVFNENGELVQRKAGAMPKQHIVDLFRKFVA